jgi:hypothetical protein
LKNQEENKTMSLFDNALAAKLSKRKEEGLFRSLKVNNNLIDFCSMLKRLPWLEPVKQTS